LQKYLKRLPNVGLFRNFIISSKTTPSLSFLELPV